MYLKESYRMILICMGIIAAIFAGDLLLKNHMERRRLPEGGEQILWGGKLLLRRHHNRGAAFNVGEKHGAAVAVLSVMLTAAAAVTLIFSFGQKGNRLLQTGLAFLLGGAFSNTYDRLRRRYVVDYISFGTRWERLRRLVFNLSDFCIIIGALLAALGAAR